MDTGSAGSASLSNCATTVTARRTWGCSVASASSVNVVAGVVSSFCGKRVSLALVDDAVQLVFHVARPRLGQAGSREKWAGECRSVVDPHPVPATGARIEATHAATTLCRSGVLALLLVVVRHGHDYLFHFGGPLVGERSL